MKICLLVVMMSTMLTGVLSACSKTDQGFYLFGDKCQYQCLCQNTNERCHEQTGACTQSQCAKGWMGPGCQFRNAADRAPVDGQYIKDLSLATDGDQKSCTSQTSTNGKPFIRVLPKTLLRVKEVYITFKNYSAISGFSVYASESSVRDPNSLCGSHDQGDVINNRVHVVCSRLMKARYITVLTNGQTNVLEVCEIEIPTGRQLSFRKNAYSSSTEMGGVPSNVVSGSVNDLLTTTLENRPWWYVDMGVHYRVDAVRIWAREGAEHYLLGYQVFVSNSTDFPERDVVYTDYSTKDTIGLDMYISVNPVLARYVRVVIPRNSARLHMREVWVLGGCPHGYCGMKCDRVCNCKSDINPSDDEVRGSCHGECTRGWKKVDGFCSTSVCSNGRFGNKCKYTCHCDGPCDPWTGRCLDQADKTGTCRKHYYGTICQAYNHLQESPFTVQGNVFHVDSANQTVDGQVGSCAPSLNDKKSWLAPIGQKKLVDQVLLYIKEGAAELGIEVSAEYDLSSTRCETHRLSDDGQYLAKCNNYMATHIRLRPKGELQICEVAMLVCADGTFGHLCENTCQCAYGAICDKTSGRCPSGGCESGYYGVNCDQECQSGFYGNQCVKHCGNCAQEASCDKFSGECPGQCVSGWQGSRCDAECPNGTYGVSCRHDCGHCLNGEPCNKATGVCGHGCHAGYRGLDCTIGCEPGTYGYNCNGTCGQCVGQQICDAVSGKCSKGCVLGRQPPYCQTDCDFGTYGLECASTCGSCRNGETCSPVTGVCNKGCAPGVLVTNVQPMCKPACADGYHGYNCSEECPVGVCYGSDVCNKTNGACPNGCSRVGYQPPYCDTECNSGTYGTNCATICGVCTGKGPCNVTTGTCPYGCEEGFDGAKCDINIQGQLSTAGIVGICIGIVVIIGIVALVIILYKRGFRNPFARNMEVNLPQKPTKPPPKSQTKPPTKPKPLTKPPTNPPTNASEMPGVNGNHPTVQNDCSPCNEINAPLSGKRCYVHRNGSAKEQSVFTNGSNTGKSIFTNGNNNGTNIVSNGSNNGANIVSNGSNNGTRIFRNGSNKGTDIVSNGSNNGTRIFSKGSNKGASIFSNGSNKGASIFSNGSNGNNNGSSNFSSSRDTTMEGAVFVEDLWEYVQDKGHSRTEITKQFKTLVSGLSHPYEAAERSPNLKKNRYRQIFAYDHSRVKLEPVPGDPGNDYINASYISGYSKRNMYIASQGPTEAFINDFWRMIWQTRSTKIVMLTRLVENNKVKCSQYWPDEGVQNYGTVSVEVKAVDSYSDYDIRTFIVSAGGREKREVKQYHHGAWSDRQVPEYASSIINFWSQVRTSDPQDNMPIIVHCSAGIGRTGTYLALDYLVDQVHAEGYVNVRHCVENLRHQRVNMVPTQEQYVFVHEALVEALFCHSTVIPYSTFSQTYTNMLEYDLKLRKTRLQLEFEKLQTVTKFQESLSPNYYETEDYKSARTGVNVQKNRTKFILPNDNYRPWLTSRVSDRNDYINAVYLPSHRDDKVFIVTQNPYQNTIVDFWRMVYEDNVATIVTMDKVNKATEIFWPEDGDAVTFVPFTIHHVTHVDHGTFIERTISLQNGAEPHVRPRMIKQFECKFWLNDSLPMTSDGILAVHDHVTQWQKTQPKHPVVVNCMNGATKSGLYCVVSATIERLKQERDVAIQQTIKQMRIRRHQIIPNYEQYRLCHDLITDFLREFDKYSTLYI